MTVVVTGAAGGIGSAVVRQVLAAGSHVVAVDLHRGEDERASWVCGDVADPAVLKAAMASALELGGSLALVTAVLADNCGLLLDLPADAVTATVQAQIEHAHVWSRAVVEASGTAIVHVSSMHANLAQAGMAPYAIAKSALESLTRAMAVEWGPLGVRCNAVAPGFVPVPRNAHRNKEIIAGELPLRRVVTADDVAAAVMFLASEEAAGITGVCLAVDAGMSAAMPGWA